MMPAEPGQNAAGPQVPAPVVMPRHEQDRFFPMPAPANQLPFLWWSAAKAHRQALLLFGAGFFSVFTLQSHFFVQVVLGAPLFEEMLKFGLALLLVAWLPARTSRLVAGVLTVTVALALGAGFGILEHWVTYRAESNLSYLWRVVFHSGSTGLSALLYSFVASSFEVRTRWLALAPSILLHYANNAGSVFLVPVTAVAGSGVMEAWNYVILAAMAACLLWVAVAPGSWRSYLEGVVARRLGPPPVSAWEAEGPAPAVWSAPGTSERPNPEPPGGLGSPPRAERERLRPASPQEERANRAARSPPRN
jgi:hypothetical protein